MIEQKVYNKLLLFICLPFFGFCQYSERFENLTSGLEVINSWQDTLYYKNGNIKEVFMLSTYDINDYRFELVTDSTTIYYKNGNIAYQYFLDKFSNIMKAKLYYNDGTLYEEWETISLDTKAKDVLDFFEKENHLIAIRNFKFYRFDYDKCDVYKFKEGKMKNGKKIGLWKFYDKNGTLKKEKNYD